MDNEFTSTSKQQDFSNRQTRIYFNIRGIRKKIVNNHRANLLTKLDALSLCSFKF